MLPPEPGRVLKTGFDMVVKECLPCRESNVSPVHSHLLTEPS
jgi:hypothetical protein